MIIFFSGTGNSRFVAKRLGSMLNDEIISINDYLKSGKRGNFESEKPYVFVTPCYMSRMPMKIESFLMDAGFKGSRDAYFVMTASQAIGNAGKHCEKICKKHGLRYRGIQGIEMPGNYVVMYDVTDRANSNEVAQQSLPAIDRICALIKSDNDLKNQGLNGHKSYTAIAPIFTATMVKSKKFHVEESCTDCGKCKELCPLGNISYQSGKPVWGNNCMHCMACISACPAKAIQYGNVTKNRNRYYLDS